MATVVLQALTTDSSLPNVVHMTQTECDDYEHAVRAAHVFKERRTDVVLLRVVIDGNVRQATYFQRGAQSAS